MTKVPGMDDISWEEIICETVPAKSLKRNLNAYRAGRDAIAYRREL